MKILIKKLIVLLTVLSFFIHISANANETINTKDFINELRIKILNHYKILPDDIVITWNDEDIEQKIKPIIRSYPKSKISLKLNDLIIKSISGREGIPADLYIDDKLNRIVYLKCKVEIFKRILVATENIKRGDIINETNVNFSKVPINKIITNSEELRLNDVLGKESIIDLSKGMVISSQLLRQKIVVFRGNQVTIKVMNGGLTLTSVGQVLQDGYVGQSIRVKIIGFGDQKTVFATVKSSDLVEIDLGSNTQ